MCAHVCECAVYIDRPSMHAVCSTAGAVEPEQEVAPQEEEEGATAMLMSPVKEAAPARRKKQQKQKQPPTVRAPPLQHSHDY